MKVPRFITSRVPRLVRNLTVGQRGFTLIELLVVVLILGVLAAVVIPNVSRFAGKGKTEALNTELDNVQAAVDALIAENKMSMDISGSGVDAICDFALDSTTKAYFNHPADTPPGSGPAVANAASLYPTYLRQQRASPDTAGYQVASDGTITQVAISAAATAC